MFQFIRLIHIHCNVKSTLNFSIISSLMLHVNKDKFMHDGTQTKSEGPDQTQHGAPSDKGLQFA